ncbi:hypothetical protein GLOIN_2v1870697 [Rhizophagus irregularis DAOM 181602=DAOM 197198]|uniref:Uncharacterized protein n=2 Tax=Rhizophagus irregularis TaxID=588596 RepID=A0A2P4QKL5_RHIID|nr:hypothetical protein GLOIN_2v1870697 [Rhizophagus irregularis DAOM 181602=DAOM 197198]POG78174.1 hypothetical protein GLOIN_2v1870697 [Rhizophagus irregularis DAOM 181602=DAOM 197198]|eukprot:XP_025185040.1 hypothetical protein GLOIN_2v1870697 [Rhizophagus irregularis DAOM 181602=DAOM 197198]
MSLSSERPVEGNWHLAISNVTYSITNMSTLTTDLDKLPETNNEKFKSILVYLIHRKLPHGFKKGSHQLVSLACTKHQFFDIFKGEILNNPLWGQKFYDEEQQTYVILFNDPPEHLKNNPLAIATHCATESIATHRRKSRYNPGEVIIEWKIKGEKDAKENYCEAGFIYSTYIFG